MCQRCNEHIMDLLGISGYALEFARTKSAEFTEYTNKYFTKPLTEKEIITEIGIACDDLASIMDVGKHTNFNGIASIFLIQNEEKTDGRK